MRCFTFINQSKIFAMLFIADHTVLTASSTRIRSSSFISGRSFILRDAKGFSARSLGYSSKPASTLERSMGLFKVRYILAIFMQTLLSISISLPRFFRALTILLYQITSAYARAICNFFGIFLIIFIGKIYCKIYIYMIQYN